MQGVPQGMDQSLACCKEAGRFKMTSRPILCGKCGTSSDDEKPLIVTYRPGDMDGLEGVEIHCRVSGCSHAIEADSLPAALAKFEEPVK